MTDDQLGYTAAVIVSIARVAHEANRGWQASLRESVSHSWDEVSEHIRQSAVDGVLNILRNPATMPGESHRNWLAFKEADGWVYGDEKDEDAKTHPCMVPFEDLPPQQQLKDVLFGEIVRTMADQLIPPAWIDQYLHHLDSGEDPFLHAVG